MLAVQKHLAWQPKDESLELIRKSSIITGCKKFIASVSVFRPTFSCWLLFFTLVNLLILVILIKECLIERDFYHICSSLILITEIFHINNSLRFVKIFTILSERAANTSHNVNHKRVLL